MVYNRCRARAASPVIDPAGLDGERGDDSRWRQSRRDGTGWPFPDDLDPEPEVEPWVALLPTLDTRRSGRPNGVTEWCDGVPMMLTHPTPLARRLATTY